MNLTSIFNNMPKTFGITLALITNAQIAQTQVIMSNTPQRVCNVQFQDPGGSGNYASYNNLTQTFSPILDGDKVSVSFSSFSMGGFYDYLYVYDGPNTSSPLIGEFLGGYYNSSLPPSLTASGVGGELTFSFYNSNNTGAGWEATINCIQPETHRLYGVTKNGGSGNGGTIYSINNNGSSYKTLAEFPQTLDGYNLNGNLIEHPDGNFYGLFNNGGAYNGGVFAKISKTGEMTTLYSFGENENIYYLRTFGILLGSDGNFYGWRTVYPSPGNVFKITTAGEYTTLKSFGYTGGNNPNALIEASDGNLYGICQQGSTVNSSNFGIIFTLSKTGSYTKLLDISNGDMNSFGIKLIEAPNGDIYGSNATPGSQSLQNILFKFTKSGALFILKMLSFRGSEGYDVGPLTLGSDGNFYGKCSSGGIQVGSSMPGTIFKLTQGGVFSVLRSINAATDGYPSGFDSNNNLVLGGDGNLYGIHSGENSSFYNYTIGNGTVYRITPSGTFSVLKNFSSTIDGISPLGLMKGKDGDIYGTCGLGGLSNKGTFFKISTATGSFLKLDDNYVPISVNSSDGNLYGISGSGGASGYGEFKKASLTGTVTSLRQINNNLYGLNPIGNLLLAPDGNYYGVCQKGGTNQVGTIFKMTPAGDLTKVYDFKGSSSNEGNPIGSLILASDGYMYGTCKGGYQDNDYSKPFAGEGCIYRIGTAAGSYMKMADFDEYTFDRGFQPNGNLIQLADGNFYGTCSKGGTNDKGTIFSMDNVGAITVIKDLVEATDGSEPMGSLALATDGYMYGLCSKGGENGDGTVFRVGTTTGDFTTIISLNDASQVQKTGKKPSGSLYSASNGQLYGTCEEGGKYYGINDYSNSIYSGTIFKLKLPGDFIKLVDLNNSTQRNSGDVDAPIQTGRNPVGGSFVEGIDGFLYGVATNGGIEIPAANYYDQIKSYGTIYKLSKSGKEYTKLRDFEPAPDGNKPEFAGLISVAGVCSDPIVSIKLSSSEVCERSVITLTVSITGTIGTPSLQWQRGNYAIDYNGYGDINTASNFINIINDSIMNGATTASLTITVNPNMNDFAFRCNVADACGSTLSNLLGFKVFPNVTPTITLTSTIQAICAGDGVPFRVDRTDPFKVNYNARNSYTIYVNGIPFQTSEPNYFYNLPTFNVTSLTNASIVTATMTTTGQLCLVKNTATSTGIAISVYPKPLVTLNLVPDTITVITPITTLAGGLPEGGTYSGGSTFAPFYFFPQSAGLGDKSIIYSFTNPGCTVTAQQNLTVIKAKQAITGMNNIYDQPIGNQTLLLNGVQGGLSGNDVNFSIKTDPLVGVAVLSAKVISFLGVGNITLTASQIGDVKYFAADTVRRSFAISSKQGQSISGFAALPDLAVGNVYTISGVAPGVTGNPVTFSSSNPLVAAVNGNIITAVSEGSAIITAFQAGNDTYLSATTNQPLAIVAAFSTFSSQTIKNFNALPILKVGDTFNINGVTGGESGNKVSFTSSDLSVATIDGVTIYALKSGNTIITATQAGNTKYLNATPIFQLLTVQSETPPVAFTKLPQTIVGVTTRIKVSVNQSIATLFSSNRGLPLMYRIDSSAIASITKGIITGKRAGLATLIVSQPGDSAFLPATSIFVPILVVDKPSPITFSIAGPDTVGLFQEVIYSQLLVAGYRYHWSYTGNKLLFISDTTSNLNQIQVYFNDLTTQGDILNDIYDNEGAFVGRFRLPISIISFPQSRDLAFVDCEVSTNCKDNYIKYFKLNSLENASGCSSGGIGDFTSTGKVDTLLMGDNCSADVKSTTTTKNAYFGIWIDYNNNGSFADADDFVASSFEADSVFSIKNLIIRNNNTYAGARRLRINMRIGGRISTQNSCLVAGEAGETEDYLVFIKGQDALEASPIITPNEDGKNDIFQIRGINPKESNKLSILDRIGAMRYEKVNYENDWRGVDKNGNMLDEGTYFYFFNNGERQIKGFLEVKRE